MLRSATLPVPFLDFLFPKYSLSGEEGEWITEGEMARMVTRPRIFSKGELKRLGMGSLDRVLAVSTYTDTPLLRKAIATFKYRRIPGLGETLQTLLRDSFRKHLPIIRDSCLCPVPLHFLRHFERGFNQAEVLARGLAEQLQLPCCNLLRRIRPTGKQTKRKRSERWETLRGAFRLQRGFGFGFGLGRSGVLSFFPNPNPNPPPFCVYLIDDLFTTGATLEECAKVLKSSGVKRVEGVVLAHG